jgi:hypothetical protein
MIPLPVRCSTDCGTSVGLAIDATGTGAVATFATGHLAVVDLRSRQFAGTIAVGGQPGGVVLAGNEAIVADESGKALVRVDLAKGDVTARVRINRKPWMLGLDDSGTKVGILTDVKHGAESLMVLHLKDGRVEELRDVGQAPAELRDMLTSLFTKLAYGIRKEAYGPRRRAGIRVEGSSVWLKLTDGREIAVGHLAQYGQVAGVGVDPEERFAYALTGMGHPAYLLKFHITAREALSSQPASRPAGTAP